ncbi:complex I NDUFA9 subunit family protein [Novosphingobium sp. AAP93]|uniref:complex I NDUFA9 subunit family protein n=1 Tax=Novosphingobium sp. AAP93 TaxID=1523427 RepID=UPI0006B956DF|nr:complex I NDUFA9 subunit family protein [Novosphingobium sp. AAP93]KPF84810.1 3-beta hydroxysteroid dehydrogenase [Novosphingobium sp. AAP93]
MSKDGGRDLDGQLIAVVGGSGFIGTHVAQALLSRGARLRVCSRHPERGYRLKTLGGLGKIQLVAVDVTKPHTLEVALTGCDAVVNLVGAFTGKLDAVQGSGAGQLAAIARAKGAKAFVHVSAIGADAASSVAYASTKAAGEAAVLAAFPEAVVLRPSVVFGEDDAFINLFAGLIASAPVMPVFAADSRFQPVFVDDVADAVANVLAAPADFAGKTFELGGPDVITIGELNRRIAKAAGRSPKFLELPDGVSAAFASLTGWLPGAPMSRDQWTLLRQGNVVSGTLPGLAELGVQARPLDLFLGRWMVRFRKAGRFGVRTKAA